MYEETSRYDEITKAFIIKGEKGDTIIDDREAEEILTDHIERHKSNIILPKYVDSAIKNYFGNTAEILGRGYGIASASSTPGVFNVSFNEEQQINIELRLGGIYTVKFNDDVILTTDPLQLKMENNDPKPVLLQNENIYDGILSGDIITFMYDGSSFRFINDNKYTGLIESYSDTTSESEIGNVDGYSINFEDSEQTFIPKVDYLKQENTFVTKIKNGKVRNDFMYESTNTRNGVKTLSDLNNYVVSYTYRFPNFEDDYYFVDYIEELPERIYKNIFVSSTVSAKITVNNNNNNNNNNNFDNLPEIVSLVVDLKNENDEFTGSYYIKTKLKFKKNNLNSNNTFLISYFFIKNDKSTDDIIFDGKVIAYNVQNTSDTQQLYLSRFENSFQSSQVGWKYLSSDLYVPYEIKTIKLIDNNGNELNYVIENPEIVNKSGGQFLCINFRIPEASSATTELAGSSVLMDASFKKNEKITNIYDEELVINIKLTKKQIWDYYNESTTITRRDFIKEYTVESEDRPLDITHAKIESDIDNFCIASFVGHSDIAINSESIDFEVSYGFDFVYVRNIEESEYDDIVNLYLYFNCLIGNNIAAKLIPDVYFIDPNTTPTDQNAKYSPINDSLSYEVDSVDMYGRDWILIDYSNSQTPSDPDEIPKPLIWPDGSIIWPSIRNDMLEKIKILSYINPEYDYYYTGLSNVNELEMRFANVVFTCRVNAMNRIFWYEESSDANRYVPYSERGFLQKLKNTSDPIKLEIPNIPIDGKATMMFFTIPKLDINTFTVFGVKK